MDIILCPICGCVLDDRDKIYKDSENEIVGCENCISERMAEELRME